MIKLCLILLLLVWLGIQTKTEVIYEYCISSESWKSKSFQGSTNFIINFISYYFEFND